MTDERIDLSPLDPTRDEERFERVVASIAGRARGELARRRSRAGVLVGLALWTRPALAAAALLLVAAVTVLARSGSDGSAGEVPADLARAVGVPDELALWMDVERTPTPRELITTLEETR